MRWEVVRLAAYSKTLTRNWSLVRLLHYDRFRRWYKFRSEGTLSLVLNHVLLRQHEQSGSLTQEGERMREKGDEPINTTRQHDDYYFFECPRPKVEKEKETDRDNVKGMLADMIHIRLHA